MKPKTRFHKLKKSERAVAVAKDVLKHLDTLRMTQGDYLSGTLKLPAEQIGKIDAGTQMQTLCDVATERCRVCAIGACFLSHVRLFNEVSLGDVLGRQMFEYRKADAEYLPFSIVDTVMRRYLDDYFGRQNLQLIEAAFERCTGYAYGHHQAYDAVEFGAKFALATNRMQAIMENVIANNGTFIPPITKDRKKDAQTV